MKQKIKISGSLTRIIVLLTYFLLIFLLSCGVELIQIPNPCTDKSSYNGRDLNITFITNITIDNKITIDEKGFIYGENIIMKDSTFSRVAKIGGYLCGDNNFEVNVLYTDTTETCGLKITGNFNSNLLSGIISFCPNSQNCNYIQIGSIGGSYTNEIVVGNVSSPLYNCEFSASL
jgi:hypothetical protein